MKRAAAILILTCGAALLMNAQFGGLGNKLGNQAFAYNASADRRSWAAMLSLFEEAFGAR